VSIIPADSGQQQTQAKREFLSSAAPWAETFSKAVAGMAIALYASGFLTVSLRHSQFGFVGANPFRPRVLAAGAWFFLFTSIPVSLAATLRAYSWRLIGRHIATMWITCVLFCFPLGDLLFNYTPVSSRTFIHLPLWGWIAFGVVEIACFAVWLLAMWEKGFFGGSATYRYPWVKIPEWIAITGSILLTLPIAAPLLRLYEHQFDAGCLAVWFFAVAIFALTQFKTRNRENLSSFGGWASPMGWLLAALLLFSQYVYPHMQASWGGGTPVNVTVYFTKDSLLNPNKAVQAQLIDESDEGFYILGLKESKAIFVPRGAVAMVYFSDKPAESPILQGNKTLAP
jgi:hypothetical protein